MGGAGGAKGDRGRGRGGDEEDGEVMEAEDGEAAGGGELAGAGTAVGVSGWVEQTMGADQAEWLQQTVDQLHRAGRAGARHMRLSLPPLSLMPALAGDIGRPCAQVGYRGVGRPSCC